MARPGIETPSVEVGLCLHLSVVPLGPRSHFREQGRKHGIVSAGLTLTRCVEDGTEETHPVGRLTVGDQASGNQHNFHLFSQGNQLVDGSQN